MSSVCIPIRINVKVKPFKDHSVKTFPNISEEQFGRYVGDCLSEMGITDGDYSIALAAKKVNKINEGRLILRPIKPDNNAVLVAFQYPRSQSCYMCYLTRSGMNATRLFALLTETNRKPFTEPVEPVEKPTKNGSAAGVANESSIVTPSIEVVPKKTTEAEVTDRLCESATNHRDFLAYSELAAELEAKIAQGSIEAERLKKLLSSVEREVGKNRRSLEELNLDPETKRLKRQELRYQEYLSILCPKEVASENH